MRSIALPLLVGAVWVGACSGTATPTAPIIVTPAPVAAPVPPPEIPAAPVARLSVSIDGSGSYAAIAAASTVSFDAGGSSGSGLRYGLDFGDGQGIDAVNGAHVYTAARVYRVRLIVTDSLGRTDQATADVTVKSIAGYWSNSTYNQSARRYESRALDIMQQSGAHVTGQYTHPEGWTTPFSGDVSASRGATLSLSDGTISFASDGTSGFNLALTSLNVRVRGGSADGLILTFTRYSSGF
jgi:PKD repeat protein